MRLNICDIIKLPLYYSGFCITDNKTFCEFYMKKFPKLNQEFKPFEFTEQTLSFEIGGEVLPEKNEKGVSFGDFLLDNGILFDYFIDKHKEVKFFWLNKWFGKNKSGLIGIVKSGKLVGMFKTRKRRLSHGTSIQEEGKRSGKKAILKRKISSKES
jgi:hypothetical protein